MSFTSGISKAETLPQAQQKAVLLQAEAKIISMNWNVIKLKTAVDLPE